MAARATKSKYAESRLFLIRDVLAGQFKDELLHLDLRLRAAGFDGVVRFGQVLDKSADLL
jgi:hypothetical protein